MKEERAPNSAASIEQHNSIKEIPLIKATDEFFDYLFKYANTIRAISDLHPEIDSDPHFSILQEIQGEMVNAMHNCATAIIEATIKMDERIDLIVSLFTIADAEQADYAAKIKKEEPTIYIKSELKKYIETEYKPQDPRSFVEAVTRLFRDDFEEHIISLYKARHPNIFKDTDTL